MPFLNLFSRIPFLPLLSSNQYSIRPFFARKRGEFIAFSPDTWILPSAGWKRKQSCTGTGSRRNRNRICARARQVNALGSGGRGVCWAGHALDVGASIAALFEARRTCEYPCQNGAPHHPRLVKCALTPRGNYR